MLRIANARAITPGRILENACVTVRGGRIAEITAGTAQPCEGCTEIDAGGLFLSPGFVDLHTHGGGGRDFMDGTAEAYLGAAETHARHGTTALLPTLLPSGAEEFQAAVSAFRQAQAANRHGAALLGLHLEGPYLNPLQKGAINASQLREPNPEEYLAMLDVAGPGGILLWTAAPELTGALEFARTLRDRGVVVSAGHSDALYQEAEEGFESGFTHATHLYSAMSTVRRIHAWRHAGLLEYALWQDGMTVELIADGCHLPASLLKLICKIKGPGRVALVTDSMRAAGMPEGEYCLGADQNVIVEDGVAKLPDRSAFAGSVATADRLVRTMVQQAGVSIEDAVRMMTATPAHILGMGRNKGSLSPGMDADLVLFDKDVNVKMTIVGGRPVYQDTAFQGWAS